MDLYEVVTKEDKMLRKRSQEVPSITPNVVRMLDRMAETMYAANGVGLAAPQIGILKRAVVVDIGEEGPGLLKLINPVILERSGEQEGMVKRSAYVKVQALTPEGDEIIIEAEDFLARALQHEIDHLEGVLFIDIASEIEYDQQ